MFRLARMALAALLAAFALPAAAAAPAPYDVALRQVTLVDESRPIKASMGFAGSPTRRIDVMIWYPAGATDAPAPGGPWPLVIYSHGTMGTPDNATHIVNELVRAGYIVAAPTYPLTSSSAFTRVRGPDISDVGMQVKDVRFVIDRLLADPVIGPVIDRTRIGITGHSLGGVTSYFTVWGQGIRDPRVKAVALIAAGDPVQTALSNGMGLVGTQHAEVSVPALFLTAEKDVFARTTGRPYAAYARVEGPKHQLMIRGGAHVWFTNNGDAPPGNRNPDCLFFDRFMPGHAMPGCEERVPLIGALRQQQITRTSLRLFFDGYLKGNMAAIRQLRAMGRRNRDVSLIFEE